jgi:hypothetical protein
MKADRGTRRPGRRGEAAILLEAIPAAILGFELFVEGLEFLSDEERRRLTIAGGEIFDNIIKHASPVEERAIALRVARRASEGKPSLLLAFYFRSTAFASFAEGGGFQATEPLFDLAKRRWRGIGLVMCRNIASKVVFRPGEFMDRIFLEFDPPKDAVKDTILLP